MRLVSYGWHHEVRLGALVEQRVVDIRRAYQRYCRARGMDESFADRLESMIGLLSSDGDVRGTVDEAIRFVLSGSSSEGDSLQGVLLDVSMVQLVAPLSNPGKVLCIGGNFPAAGKLSAPEYPIVFLKPASTITAAGMPIRLSNTTANVAYEVELVVVIGKRARNVPREQAAGYIAGYTIANDLGDRVLEKRTSQWTSGKMFDTFTPLGPAIVTPDEIASTRNLLMQTWVNEQQVQGGCTAEMFFDCDSLVSYLSTLTTLEPGDIILTGSPKLMGGEPAPSVALKRGDTVRIAVEGLGELINPVMAEAE